MYFIDRNRITQNACIDDTFSGLKKNCIDDSRTENLDDDDIFVTHHEASTHRALIMMALGNILNHLGNEDLALAIDTVRKHPSANVLFK